MLVTSSIPHSSLTAPSRSPTPQPPPETTSERPATGSPSAARASSEDRASRNAAEMSGCTSSTLSSPAIRRTESNESSYMARCRSMPGWAQKNKPVRSVIVATVGQSTIPRRRSRASTTVTAG